MLLAEVAPRRLRLRRVGIAVVALAVGVLIAWGLTFTALFHAKTVRVEGIKRLGTRQVMRIAQITPGTNVFHLDASAAARRLEQNPWVAAAAVTVQLPSTVVIGVTERVPVALVKDSEGGAQWVAGDGVVVGAATGREQIPTIGGADAAALPDAASRRRGRPRPCRPCYGPKQARYRSAPTDRYWRCFGSVWRCPTGNR